MTEEEKEAVKYTENCLMKITMGIDCEFDVNILDALINIIEKLQKENEELEEINNELEAEKNEAIRRYNFETIPIKKVKDKIEELQKTNFNDYTKKQDGNEVKMEILYEFKKMLESEE